VRILFIGWGIGSSWGFWDHESVKSREFMTSQLILVSRGGFCFMVFVLLIGTAKYGAISWQCSEETACLLGSLESLG
jgi:hypothetical protein